MNLPVGEVVEEGVNIKEIDFKQKISELGKQNFSGYLVLMSEGNHGLEEGILVFRSGNVIGSLYEYLKYEKPVFGKDAIPRTFNSFLSSTGVYDLISLTQQQSELVIAFNTKIRLEKPLSVNDINKFFVKEYSTKLSEEALSSELRKEKTKFDLFKQFGLSSLGKH